MSLIFVTDKENKADLKICEVKEYKADLKYWITDKEHKAKRDDAKWCYVNREHKADKAICWVKEHKADLKVCEVSKEYKAKGSFK